MDIGPRDVYLRYRVVDDQHIQALDPFDRPSVVEGPIEWVSTSGLRERACVEAAQNKRVEALQQGPQPPQRPCTVPSEFNQ